MGLGMPWQLRVYRAATVVFSPVILLHLVRRRFLGIETSLTSRLGMGPRPSSGPEPGTATVWVHGASVGESLSGLSLAQLLSASDGSLRFVVTSGTSTGLSVLNSRIAADPKVHASILGVAQAPLDIPFCIARFLDAWQPQALVCIESDLWPNTLWECHARGMLLLLVDGRMSRRSSARWACFPAYGLISTLLSKFSLVLCQTKGDAERLEALQAPNARCLGSAKLASSGVPVAAELVKALGESLAEREVWVAASTHAGEEEIVAASHRGLLTRWLEVARDERGRPGTDTTQAEEAQAQGKDHHAPDPKRSHRRPPLLVIVPRHPHRAHEVARRISELHSDWYVRLDGFPSASSSADNGNVSVVVAGYMGATGPWMSVASVCLVGGSLVPGVGGHNVIEPAQLGCAVLHGQFTEANDHLIEALHQQDPGSTRVVKDAGELEEVLWDLVAGRGAGERAKQAAEGLRQRVRSELDASVRAVLDGLPRR